MLNNVNVVLNPNNAVWIVFVIKKTSLPSAVFHNGKIKGKKPVATNAKTRYIV
jgi:hypothetical protein